MLRSEYVYKKEALNGFSFLLFKKDVRIYLKQAELQRVGEAERGFIYGFTPQVSATAEAQPGCNQEAGVSSMPPMWRKGPEYSGLHEPFETCLYLLNTLLCGRPLQMLLESNNRLTPLALSSIFLIAADIESWGG